MLSCLITGTTLPLLFFLPIVAKRNYNASFVPTIATAISLFPVAHYCPLLTHCGTPVSLSTHWEYYCPSLITAVHHCTISTIFNKSLPRICLLQNATTPICLLQHITAPVCLLQHTTPLPISPYCGTPLPLYLSTDAHNCSLCLLRHNTAPVCRLERINAPSLPAAPHLC